MNNDILKTIDSELLFEAVVEGLELFIFENKLNYLRVPSFHKLTLNAAEQVRLTIIEFNKGKGGGFCNIIEFESDADIDPSVREWGANRPDGITSIADAVVINGMAQRMLANFYMKMNRPKKPTKFFNNLESSISWSLEQLEKQMSD